MAYRERYRKYCTPSARVELCNGKDEIDDNNNADIVYDQDSNELRTVFGLVLEFVDAKSVMSFSMVSKAFRSYATQNSLWATLAFRDMGVPACTAHAYDPANAPERIPLGDGHDERHIKKTKAEVHKTAMGFYWKHMRNKGIKCIDCIGTRSANGESTLLAPSTRLHHASLRSTMMAHYSNMLHTRMIQRLLIIHMHSNDVYELKDFKRGMVLAAVRAGDLRGGSMTTTPMNQYGGIKPGTMGRSVRHRVVYSRSGHIEIETHASRYPSTADNPYSLTHTPYKLKQGLISGQPWVNNAIYWSSTMEEPAIKHASKPRASRYQQSRTYKNLYMIIDDLFHDDDENGEGTWRPEWVKGEQEALRSTQ